MRKQIFFTIFILHSFISVYSQSNNPENVDRLKTGNEIITNSRKAIGIDKVKINAFHYKIKQILSQQKNSDRSPTETTSEIKIILPDRIQSVLAFGLGGETTSIWNGEKYKSFTVIDMFGTRHVKDNTIDKTNTISDETLKTMEGKLGKKQTEFLKNAKNAKRQDPKFLFYESLWTDLFPLILSHPFESNLEFKYIGKAEAKSQIANVVEITSKSGKKYQLFFDSKTHYLLMMFHKQTSNSGEMGGMFDGNREFKYYFSNRELFGKVLIPKQVKIESNFTPIGSKETKLFYSTVDIEEFSVNPELKESIFEIK